MAYFECTTGIGAGGGATITVTYNSSFYNKTMTCSNGTKTYTKTTTSSGSTEFKVSDAGTWTITCNGISRTVNVVLNYSIAMAITKTITVYGAAGATISFTDAVGAKTVTLNNSGQGSVSITIIPPSQSITFTDTNKSKNPNNLSQNFSRAITISESTSAIYVMPTNTTLYWYGYKSSNLESTTTANGWSNYVNGTVTYNTNSVTVGANGGIGNKTSISSISKVHSICKSTEALASIGLTVRGGTAKDGNSPYVAQSVTNTIQKITYTGSANYALVNAVDRNRAGEIYALWYE